MSDTPLKDAAQTLDQQIALKAVLTAASNLRQVLYDEMKHLPELRSFRGRAGILALEIHHAAGLPAPPVIVRD